MNIIYIVKALMIGSMGAGGFYFLISFLLHYFPLPLFLKTQNVVDAWAIKHYKTEKALDKIWNVGNKVAQITVTLMWLVILAAYVYLLYQVLSFYIPIDNRSTLFLYYYLIAIALPIVWVLFRIATYAWAKRKANQLSPPVKTPPRKTLIEQMEGK
ncbi:hypothetical protein [Aureispira sp. CCB-E]|uniref:hypothetical protein n=1 Tax=Aureispira sp. CCB-E TaxID=3051121 RepID=UPI0028690E63|nr:hypothetical protein [Aureispira sp. CCB-E]WMX15372.1 hypothetical protein QP953_03165 [Aureispira sp. CCB-E]